MQKWFLAVALGVLPSMGFAETFSVSFTWDGMKSCAASSPSPQFVVAGLPEGTQVLDFTLRDLDYLPANHLGGRVKISADGTIPFGAFSYNPPCPPNGAHRYEWTVIARDKAGMGGKKLGVTKVLRSYPE